MMQMIRKSYKDAIKVQTLKSICKLYQRCLILILLSMIKIIMITRYLQQKLIKMITIKLITIKVKVNMLTLSKMTTKIAC